MLGYLFVAATLLLQRQHSSAELAHINSDGFNIYKDLLRSKYDEPYSFHDQYTDPSVYVYQPGSLLLLSDTAPLTSFDSGTEKRGVNHFKSLMLSPPKDEITGDAVPDKSEDTIYHFPRVMVKRSIKGSNAPCLPCSSAGKKPQRAG